MPASSGNTSNISAGTGAPATAALTSQVSSGPSISPSWAELAAAEAECERVWAVAKRTMAETNQYNATVQQLEKSGDSEASRKIAEAHTEFMAFMKGQTEELKKSQGADEQSGTQGSDKSSGA